MTSDKQGSDCIFREKIALPTLESTLKSIQKGFLTGVVKKTIQKAQTDIGRPGMCLQALTWLESDIERKLREEKNYPRLGSLDALIGVSNAHSQQKPPEE